MTYSNKLGWMSPYQVKKRLESERDGFQHSACMSDLCAQAVDTIHLSELTVLLAESFQFKGRKVEQT